MIRRATILDAGYIGLFLRQADRREMAAAIGAYSPDEVQESFTESDADLRWAVDYAGHPAAMFGVGPDPDRPGRGVAWMLATDAIVWCAPDVARMVARGVDRALLRYDCLSNWIAQSNAEAIRLADWIGVRWDERHIERGGESFRLFHVEPSTRRGRHVCV